MLRVALQEGVWSVTIVRRGGTIVSTAGCCASLRAATAIGFNAITFARKSTVLMSTTCARCSLMRLDRFEAPGLGGILFGTPARDRCYKVVDLC
jgi:hypothetical protein